MIICTAGCSYPVSDLVWGLQKAIPVYVEDFPNCPPLPSGLCNPVSVHDCTVAFLYSRSPQFANELPSIAIASTQHPSQA